MSERLIALFQEFTTMLKARISEKVQAPSRVILKANPLRCGASSSPRRANI